MGGGLKRRLWDVVGEETAQSGGSDAPPTPDAPPKPKRWYQRPTVRTLRKEAAGADREFTRKWDERENDETRLPTSEEIHLGGLVLAEAFTPSTVSALYEALEQWPNQRRAKRQEWLDDLARSRAGHRGGWQSLGVVRPVGAFVMGDGYQDPDLPFGVDAVWVKVSYVTPALAMVVATFTLTEAAGDLSEILRQDYRTRHFDTQVRVYGRLGDLRARIPWARPKRHGTGYSISHAEDQKRRACQALIASHEEACRRWFFKRFRGRFAAAKPDDRPTIRMLFTKEQVPYAERRAWMRPIDLDFALPLWRSTEIEGWWLSEERWPHRKGHHIMTLAARRSDAAKEPDASDNGDSNWYLTQGFGSDQDPLAARHALPALLAIYSDRLSRLRDKAGIRRRLRWPVREGRNLDDYLIRDGLDAATVTSDLDLFTKDLTSFRWGVPEFIEDLEHLGGKASKREPLDLVPALCTAIREQATRLANDTRTTTENIKASAELRQAIANTRLQRLTLALSMVAAIIAVISLLAAAS